MTQAEAIFLRLTRDARVSRRYMFNAAAKAAYLVRADHRCSVLEARARFRSAREHALWELRRSRGMRRDDPLHVRAAERVREMVRQRVAALWAVETK